MSFGSSGFGGFGSTNNNQQSTGFGGFGAQNNTSTGFGATNNTSGFGGTTNTTSGGLFGSGGSTGFGNSGGAFGTPQNNNAFGAKPGGFGTPAATSSSLFGGGTATAGTTGGFGGFGTSSAPAQSSPFGGSNTGAGLFGQSKPTTGFGQSTTTPFGGGSTSSPFGATGGAFGAPASTALATTTGECQGTGSIPFTATVEKEPNSTSNQQNSFQSISFQAPYQKFSPEELRLADYTQGRKHGNASNQAGAFGSSTGFGGFGTNNQTTNTGFGGATNTGSSLFGGGASSSPFGATQPATSGFGANTNTGGGLFGAQKPATNSLFGAPAQTQSTGLFGGTSSNTGFGGSTSGFGGTNNATTGSSLFSQNNTANKPPAFSFNNSQPASSGTGFGGTTATTGFGGGLFGGTQTQNTTTPFGGQQQQQPGASNAFGSGFGQNTTQQNTGTSSLFGQSKPATGLFGQPAATGSSLFSQPAATTNAFGGANTQNTGGLFGQQKPASNGTGLFGQTNQTNTGGSNLFGGLGQNQNQTQPQTNSLFGGLNNTNQQKPSLFPQAQQQNSTGLFGSTTAPQQQGSSLFDGSLLGNNQQQQQTQQNNSLFGGGNSFLGNSQHNQQAMPSYTASINDPNAFGGASIFASLAQTNLPNPGPLATPVSNNKPRKSVPLPMYKLQPASSSRFSTPARGGFGFTYSNYNSPGSATSTSSTPGNLTRGFLGSSSYGRGLSKSMSTSSLRRSFNMDDSILAPGAFSTSPSARHYGSTGSMKKLVINRGIRSDLFSPPEPQPQPSSTPNGSILKKRVSFDASTVPGGVLNGSSSPLKQTQNNSTPSAENLAYERPRPDVNGTTSLPEMEQVTGKELARVQEEDSPAAAAPTKTTPGVDMQPGAYWMKPTKAEIEGMNRLQRQKILNFEVGREGVGKIEFNAPVDLTDPNASLDTLFTETIHLEVRSATVYAKPGKKATPGKGLNVPSTITLFNSWPRKHGKGVRRSTREGIDKHVANLKKVPDTEFVDYKPENGTWIFKVPHYTTYGYDAESDEEEDLSQFGESTLSAPPDTPTPKTRTPKSQQAFERSFTSTSEATNTESDPEDTFQFRKKKTLPLPGAFDEQEVYEDEEMADEYGDEDQQSFLDERSVGSHSENGVEEPMDQDDVFEDGESVSIVDQEMAGSFPQADNTAELEGDYSQDEEMEAVMDTPGVIVRARLRAAKNSGTPVKSKFTAGNDWASTLKTTISPQKQDRALLKSLIDIHGNEPRPDEEPTSVATRGRVVSDGRGFATSIDLMNSLFGQTRSPVKAKVPQKAKGFEWPYAKRAKTSYNDISLTDIDRAFHDSMKPSWGPDGTLVYAAASNAKPFGRSSRRARERDGLLTIQKGGIVSESRDVHFAKFSNEASATALKKHQLMTVIDDSGDVPLAILPENYSFSDFFDNPNARDPASAHEKLVWQLASVLFDEIVVPDELYHIDNVAERIRKDKLSEFWQKLVDQASSRQVAMARSNEEKVIASLSGHRVPDACGHLLNGKDFHLATLVALIGKDSSRKDIREQLSEWQKQRVLSEFSQPMRAIYEILAGNVCVCDGSKGAIEDRIDSFIISQRFGLDWRQAFGLRLWYGILAADDLGVAVEKFAHDISQDRETSKPQAWYVEQKIPALWEDKAPEKRQDLLWGLLRLYAFADSDLEAVIRPENSQLSPVDIRLSWQLSRALTSSGAVTYNEDADTKADQITLSFASQLINEGSWLDAVFVLLHLASSTARAKAIQDHLAQQAGHIGNDDSPSFLTLTQTYKIPAPWVWEAKALYLRSVKNDPKGEVECLLRAGSFEEAHRTFARDVAPKTIIECDYDALRALLNGFHGKEDSISEWHLGGEIYGDFLQLLDSHKKAKAVDHSTLHRLLAGLPAVVEESRHPGFMERVAIETISGVVAKTVVEMGKNGEKSDFAKVLRLPLTEDKYLKHTVDLSLGYYRDAMAGGR